MEKHFLNPNYDVENDILADDDFDEFDFYDILSNLIDEGGAKEVIEKIEAIQPDLRSFELKVLLGRAYREYGISTDEPNTYYEKAMGIFNSIKRAGKNQPSWYFEVGYTLFLQNKFNQAVSHFKKSLKLIGKVDKNDIDTACFIEYQRDLIKKANKFNNFLNKPRIQPLEDYEKESSMFIVLRPGQFNEFLNKEIDEDLEEEAIAKYLIQLLNDDENIKATLGEDALLNVNWNGDDYGVDIFSMPVSLVGRLMHYNIKTSDAYKKIYTDENFSEDMIKDFERANKLISVIVTCDNKDCKKLFLFQMKIINMLIPKDLLAVIDETADNVFDGKWINSLVDSFDITDDNIDRMYDTKVISKDDTYWMYTKGLTRYGLPELEIMNLDKEHEKVEDDKDSLDRYYNILRTIARKMLNSNNSFGFKEPIDTCMLDDGTKLTTTLVPWTEAVKKYPTDLLGCVKDRLRGQNTLSGVIFVYKDEKDYGTNSYEELKSYRSSLPK